MGGGVMSGEQWDFGDVIARTDLRNLLGEVTASNGRSGQGEKWHCPAPEHIDRHPSVTVSADHAGKERWRCWSNEEHRGDAIDLVTTVRGTSPTEAAEWLAGRAGMTHDRPYPAPLQAKKPRPAAPTELSPIVERYVGICEAVLRGPQGDEARRWLTGRGIGPDAIRANRIGVDLGRDVMRRRKGLPYGEGPGVVFPALDPSGRVAYVQTRYLNATEAGRKYDNPASSLGPNPRVAFIQIPQGTPPRGKLMIVTEGIPDGLIAAQAGYQAVSLLGSQAPDAVTAAMITNHVADNGGQVVLALDADVAGRQGNAAMTKHLSASGETPLVVDLPEGADLNDWALTVPDWTSQLDEQVASLSLEPQQLSLKTPAQSIGMDSARPSHSHNHSHSHNQPHSHTVDAGMQLEGGQP